MSEAKLEIEGRAVGKVAEASLAGTVVKVSGECAVSVSQEECVFVGGGERGRAGELSHESGGSCEGAGLENNANTGFSSLGWVHLACLDLAFSKIYYDC